MSPLISRLRCMKYVDLWYTCMQYPESMTVCDNRTLQLSASVNLRTLRIVINSIFINSCRLKVFNSYIYIPYIFHTVTPQYTMAIYQWRVHGFRGFNPPPQIFFCLSVWKFLRTCLFGDPKAPSEFFSGTLTPGPLRVPWSVAVNIYIRLNIIGLQ